jgi:DNA polymerase III sliding clamp (beta) subunit (PCNA family)
MKDVLSRAIKGVGNNKLLPITQMICISLEDGTLTTITTDGTNYLYVREQHVAGDNFYVVVDANQFVKLISKMTCDNISMTIVEKTGALVVKGNGTYTLELPLDEEGEFIKFPNVLRKLATVATVDGGIVNKSTIQVVLETIKPALATTFENPEYTAYYMADKIVATDQVTIASMNVKFCDVPKLINADFLDLVSVVRGEKIKVEYYSNDIIFDTEDATIVGKLVEGIEDYAIDAISGLIDQPFDCFCSVPKTALLQMLDRLSLFVGPYDDNSVILTFTKDGLQVSSKASNGIEILNYIASDNQMNFTAPINVNMLIKTVKSISNDVIEIFYGDDSAIKIVDGNITIIIALNEEDTDM